MLTNNIQYELKLLLRSNWLYILLFSTVALFTFACYNGQQTTNKRFNDIKTMQEATQKRDSIMLVTLNKIEKGEEVNILRWKMPTEPMTIGYRYPRLAVMYPETLSFLATGQSDMYTHFKSPTVYGNNFALDYAEMVNPIQLVFGNFDLAFVFIYILPLLIIAFSFNILSKEKELGTLPILGAQPISIRSWLLQKMLIRYFVFTSIILICLLVLIGIFFNNAFDKSGTILILSLLIAVYNLFWFIVAFIINLKINNSAKNALSLIGLWLLIVLVLPATINQIGNSLYPTPSRLKMINEIRLIKKENEKQQDKIMSDYLRTHPELNQGNGDDKFGFWHKYFASEKIMEDKNKPLLEKYETQLKKQQNLASAFKYLSPAIILQQSLNNVAGTSENHYNDYKKQVFEFSNEWRDYFVPMLFKKEQFSTQHYNNMPVFEYKNRTPLSIWTSIITLLIINLFVFVIFGLKSKKLN